MWTKRELVLQAFGELALYGYDFELTPEELETGRIKMDAMLAEWQALGINIGYSLPSTMNGSDLDDQSGIPDTANSAVYTNLAQRLAAGFGKAVPRELAMAARQGYKPLLWAAARPTQQQLPNTLPVGAGNKPWRYARGPFFGTPDPTQVRQADNGNLDFLES